MSDANINDARKVAYKAKLLVEQLGLAAGLANAFAGRVRMIKAAERPGRLHRIMCADGSWIEIDPATCRVVRTWGRGNTAPEMAKAIAGDGSVIEHLEEEAGAVSAPGAPIRSTPVLSDDKLKTLADGWRKRGYPDVIEDERGVWVALPDGTRLHDVGRRVHIHGPRTDAALAAIAQKARDDWDGALALRGPGRDWPERDKERLWLACQREGVEYAGYEPSPKLIAKWEAEQAESMRGAGSARPDDDVSAGPAPGGIAPAPQSDAPAEPVRPDTDAALARHCERAQADLKALHARWAAEARTEEDRERLRREEAALKAKLAIYERARELARTEGLSREDAIRAAYAEAQAERGFEPTVGPRR
ncbi:hypothetical protein [Pelagibacterium lacus]|uniref:Large polyvalent protein-associated domain-containing protein n=1 Tax=Pelagibacterium lacus TaxID=2282655 RepID=A0A369W9E3_9HYPH|nr:hypothetical protein [Pelagibacterium lacus]RDE09892.1 hypothetical protein DVH29_05000 [Pelagibacterium lacus]